MKVVKKMDNSCRIEYFLKLIANACKNGMDIDSQSVYANLIYLGVDDKREDISSNFNKWIEHFKSNKNIDVFVDPSWDYFCQFISPNFDRYTHDCNIKMYIPIDSQHIEMSVIYLFEFLANENITHLSKIGKCIRFDDIVIRTNNRDNANKIIEFINNNKCIREGLLKANPFAVGTDKISMAWDNTLSYNLVVSSWISNYIKWEYDNNNLNDVSFLRFKLFVEEKSFSLFEKGEGLQEYLDNLIFDYVIKDEGFAEIRDAKLFDYCNITKILLMSLNGTVTKDNLFDFISMISYKETQINGIEKIKKLRLNIDDKSFSDSQKMAFKTAFDYMVNLYGYNKTKENFLLFMQTGNYSYITRKNGARELLYSNNIDKNIANLIVLYWKCEALDNAILATYNKYGYSHSYSALVNLVGNGDYSYFTNDNNCRINLIDRCSADSEVLGLIRDKLIYLGYDPELLKNNICRVYFDKVINNEINKKNNRA